MKNCPFCGEEIQDAAKKCKHCKEWLKFKVCPICGESIPENSSVCQYCNENLTEIEESIDEEPVISTGGNHKNGKKNKPIHKNTEGITSNGSNGIFKKIMDDYGIVLIIAVVIIVYSIFNGGNKQNSISDGERIINETSDNVNEVTRKVDQQSTKYPNTNNEYPIENELKLEGTDGGYLLRNNKYTCKIDEENIDNFIDSVNNKGVVEYCDSTSLTQNDGEISLGLFIDNSYAVSNGTIDESGPEVRINTIKRILNNYVGNKLNIYLGFLYTTKENAELAEVINNRIIKLSTDDISIKPTIKVYKKGKIEPIKNKHKVYYEKMSFVLDYQDCEPAGKDNYNCYDIESLINQIKKIYENEFDKKELHGGNPLIEYFADQKIQGYFGKIEKAYILTDGQFEITDSYKTLKTKANSMAKFPEYKISNFYVDSYSKDNNHFEKFWNDEAIKGGLGNIDCNGLSISFVGLAGGNPGFTNFMHEYFSNKMFTGCDVSFENL